MGYEACLKNAINIQELAFFRKKSAKKVIVCQGMGWQLNGIESPLFFTLFQQFVFSAIRI